MYTYRHIVAALPGERAEDTRTHDDDDDDDVFCLVIIIIIINIIDE